MSAEVELELLGQLILKPELLDAAEELDGSLFTPGNHRAAFAGIAEQWEELRPESIDVALLARKTGLSQSWLMELTVGNFRPTPATFAVRVHSLRVSRLGEKLLRVSKEAGDALVATGECDTARLSAELERARTILEPSKPNAAAFKRLSDIEGREISWLWHGRIPMGMLTLLAGDPGLGKSFLATWLGCRLSVGAALPGDHARGEAGSTIYLSAEDSATYALQPRAAKNGADLTRLIVLEGSEFDITADLEKVRLIVEANPDVKLLIIDPLNSYIGEADYFKDTAVRVKLNPLVQFAEKYGIAVLCVMHLNKKTDQAGIYRIGGSIAFAGIARSIMAVTQDPDDADRRFLRPLKMNYCRRPEPLAFRIGEDLALSFEDGPADIGADESLSVPTGREALEGSFAAEWLKEYLADGPVELDSIFSAAGPVGISRSSLFRARAKLQIKAESRPRGFGKGRATSWTLPNTSPRREI